jgi:sulfoxide reductase heme-binding subunit YedZ
MSWKLSALVALGLVSGIVLAHLTQESDSASRSWDALRAAGFTAYLLLWFSTISGMAVRLRLRPGPAPVTWLLEAHRVSGTLGLAFVAGHVAGILIDPWTDISAIDVALGATSPYRPAALLLGSVSLWLTAAVLLSTALAGRMKNATWRSVHYLAFPAYLAALLHGVIAGTDSAATPAVALYAATAAAVAALLAIRILEPRMVQHQPIRVPTGPTGFYPEE